MVTSWRKFSQNFTAIDIYYQALVCEYASISSTSSNGKELSSCELDCKTPTINGIGAQQ